MNEPVPDLISANSDEKIIVLLLIKLYSRGRDLFIDSHSGDID